MSNCLHLECRRMPSRCDQNLIVARTGGDGVTCGRSLVGRVVIRTCSVRRCSGRRGRASRVSTWVVAHDRLTLVGDCERVDVVSVGAPNGPCWVMPCRGVCGCVCAPVRRNGTSAGVRGSRGTAHGVAWPEGRVLGE